MGPRVRGCVLAAAATAAMLVLELRISPLFGTISPWLFAAYSVTFSAYVGGLPAGLIAAALACVSNVLFLHPPIAAGATHAHVQTGLFLLFTLQISVLGEVLLRSSARSRRQAYVLDAILRDSPDWATLMDGSWRYVHVSPVAAAALGHDANEMLGKTPTELRIAEELMQPLQGRREHVFASGQMDRCEVTAEIRGEKRAWECILVPIRGRRGNIEAVATFGRDITARRQAEQELRISEERFRTAFADAAIGAAVVALDGRFLHVNKAFRALLKYSEEELRGMDFMSITHPDDRQASAASVQQLMNDEIGSFVIEKRYVAKDGSIVWAQSSVSMMRDAQGVPTNTICLIENTTERVQAQRRMIWLLEQTISAQEDERKRISRELHDGVSQSITSIMAGLLSFEDVGSVEAARQRAREIRSAAAAAMDEIRRLASGLRPSVLDDLGLHAALERYAREYSSFHNIAVELDFEQCRNQRLPAAVETALYRIAQEALTNVARHASARSVHMSVEIQQDTVELIVEDDGVGFDVHTAQAADAADRHLGLHSMRERAVLLGGSVSVDSAPQQGTTVIVRIPLSAAGRGGADAPAMSPGLRNAIR